MGVRVKMLGEGDDDVDLANLHELTSLSSPNSHLTSFTSSSSLVSLPLTTSPSIGLKSTSQSQRASTLACKSTLSNTHIRKKAVPSSTDLKSSHLLTTSSTTSTRGVASLTPEQLARKRQNDREAQRAIRARTKAQIERLTLRIRELESEPAYLDTQRALRQLARTDAENQDLRHRLSSILALAASSPSPSPTSTISLPSSSAFLSTSLPTSTTSLSLSHPLQPPPPPPPPPPPLAPAPPPSTPSATTLATASSTTSCSLSSQVQVNLPSPSSPADLSCSLSTFSLLPDFVNPSSHVTGPISLTNMPRSAPFLPIPLSSLGGSHRPKEETSSFQPSSSMQLSIPLQSQPPSQPFSMSSIPSIASSNMVDNNSNLMYQVVVPPSPPPITTTNTFLTFNNTHRLNESSSSTTSNSSNSASNPTDGIPHLHASCAVSCVPLAALTCGPILAYATLPLNIPATCTLDSILLDFLAERQRLAQMGVSRAGLIGPEYPNLGPLVTPHEKFNPHPLSRLFTDILHTFPDLRHLPDQIAVVHIMFLVMRWKIDPSRENYERMPEWVQPRPSQLFTPHPAWMDLLPWPRLRDNMVQMNPFIPFDSFFVPYTTTCSVNWPYDPMECIIPASASTSTATTTTAPTPTNINANANTTTTTTTTTSTQTPTPTTSSLPNSRQKPPGFNNPLRPSQNISYSGNSYNRPISSKPSPSSSGSSCPIHYPHQNLACVPSSSSSPPSDFGNSFPDSSFSASLAPQTSPSQAGQASNGIQNHVQSPGLLQSNSSGSLETLNNTSSPPGSLNFSSSDSINLQSCGSSCTCASSTPFDTTSSNPTNSNVHLLDRSHTDNEIDEQLRETQGPWIINPVFEKHLRDLSNWSLGPLFRANFPNIAQYVNIKESHPPLPISLPSPSPSSSSSTSSTSNFSSMLRSKDDSSTSSKSSVSSTSSKSSGSSSTNSTTSSMSIPTSSQSLSSSPRNMASLLSSAIPSPVAPDKSFSIAAAAAAAAAAVATPQPPPPPPPSLPPAPSQPTSSLPIPSSMNTHLNYSSATSPLNSSLHSFFAPLSQSIMHQQP